MGLFYMGTDGNEYYVFERKPNFLSFQKPINEVRMVTNKRMPKDKDEAKATWDEASPVWYN